MKRMLTSTKSSHLLQECGGGEASAGRPLELPRNTSGRSHPNSNADKTELNRPVIHEGSEVPVDLAGGLNFSEGPDPPLALGLSVTSGSVPLPAPLESLTSGLRR